MNAKKKSARVISHGKAPTIETIKIPPREQTGRKIPTGVSTNLGFKKADGATVHKIFANCYKNTHGPLSELP